jgi:dephospho-CoA kinase
MEGTNGYLKEPATIWMPAGPAAILSLLGFQLAAEHAEDSDARAYADDKHPWFVQALPRAEEWAEATGWRPPGSDHWRGA